MCFILQHKYLCAHACTHTPTPKRVYVCAHISHTFSLTHSHTCMHTHRRVHACMRELSHTHNLYLISLCSVNLFTYKVFHFISNTFLLPCSAPLDGKNKAVECNTVPALIDLLRDPSADVRANAAGAIMMYGLELSRFLLYFFFWFMFATLENMQMFG